MQARWRASRQTPSSLRSAVSSPDTGAACAAHNSPVSSCIPEPPSPQRTPTEE